MDTAGFEIIKSFQKKLLEMSEAEKKKIEKLAKEKDGTFKGAAWSLYQNKRYSPHVSTKTKVKSNVKSKVTTTSSPKTNRSKRTLSSEPKERKPYVKELQPGIRTIMFK